MVGRTVPELAILLVEDALYANAPHIRQIQQHNHQYIINVKPKSHKALFSHFEGRKQRGSVKCHEVSEGQIIHKFFYSNNMALNHTAGDVRVNFLHYEQHNQLGIQKRFTWITSIKLSKSNVMKVMRARWKIENETFNTLKNQGYCFEHNYGHGQDQLATVLAYLMLIAFLIDQIIQKCSVTFNRVWEPLKTKKKLWNSIKSLFHVLELRSFAHLYKKLADLYAVQLE